MSKKLLAAAGLEPMNPCILAHIYYWPFAESGMLTIMLQDFICFKMCYSHMVSGVQAACILLQQIYWIILAKCSDNCSTCLLQCNIPSFGHELMVKPGRLSIFSCSIFIQFLFDKLQIIFHICCSPCTKLDNFVEEKRLQHQIILHSRNILLYYYPF